ncbi:unnamed protein product [Caenorhabditis bovis]|uniref:ethanolamine kinase n=1 Tax=Caenorhabditis bovis TaxID=2654633 RepID=A0A8S1EGZ4_9PELO|nr:unnamed protein product [Caenorhabditis bovis]
MDIQTFNKELSLTSKRECEFSALQILSSIRPQWPKDCIEFEYFSVGITNKIFAAKCDEEAVIFRVFGKNTDKIINRNNEVIAWKKLAIHSLAAPIYAQFKNGLVCGFIEGKSLEMEMMKAPETRRRIARSIAHLHKMVPRENKPICFKKMREFFSAFSSDFDDERKQKFYNCHFPANLEPEIRNLEMKITEMNEEIAFCHNDLLVHNIVYNPENNTINFIDYEYAATNYVLFEIGNHFCEYAGVEDTPDYTQCLSNVEKMAFLHDYLENRDSRVDMSRLNVMMARIPIFEAAAHLFWTIWALVQSQNSTIDFDYLAYAYARYEQYKKRYNKYNLCHKF